MALFMLYENNIGDTKGADMLTKNILIYGLLSVSAVTAVPRLAAAHEHDHHWHGELHEWHSGRWYHGHHEGRDGWWWIVGSTWHYFVRPVYPQPIVVTPPPTVIVQGQVASAPVPPPAPAPAPVQSWYHCNSPQGYYPYVTSCPGGWTTVPAAPPQ